MYSGDYLQHCFTVQHKMWHCHDQNQLITGVTPLRLFCTFIQKQQSILKKYILQNIVFWQHSVISLYKWTLNKLFSTQSFSQHGHCGWVNWRIPGRAALCGKRVPNKIISAQINHLLTPCKFTINVIFLTNPMRLVQSLTFIDN